MIKQLTEPASQASIIATQGGDRWNGRSESIPERQTITITELAKILGISRTTCYELAHRRELPVRVVRIGRRLLVSKVEVTRFLDGRGPIEARDAGGR